MTTESVAPATATATTPDIPDIVRRLRETFATGRTRSVEWRKQQLQALERLMTENEGAIAEALEKDLGRSPFEAWLADIASTAGEAKDAAKNVRSGCAASYRLLEMSQLPGRGLGRVRALRHRADHRRVELPVRVDARPRRRRHRRGQHRGAQALRGVPRRRRR